MLGLKRNTVKVVPHHPGWLEVGKETCTILRQVAGDYVLDVQHAGSTSVPNLPSKPIIEIVVPVRSFDVIPELFNRFTKVDFIYRGDFGGSMGHVFVKESAPNTVTTIVHVLEEGSGLVEQYTLFRDALLENKDLVEQ